MDIQTTVKALKLLHRARTASANSTRRVMLRVAARWLEAGLKDEYDAMLRLQTLEGAAGVPVDSWWQKGRRGFRAAQERFSDTNIDPAWLEPKNSGMMGAVHRIVQGALNSYKVPLDSDDIINNALMGLKIDPTATGRTERPAYEAGKKAEKGIIEGKETPLTLGKGTVGKWIAKKVGNETKALRKMQRLPQDEEGTTFDIPDRGTTTRGDIDHPGEYLAKMVFGDRSDPLGKRIRALMRKTWDQPGRNFREPLLLWLDEAEKGHFMSSQDLAQALGRSKQSIAVKPWKKGWREFFDAFWKDRKLLSDIVVRYMEMGYPVELQKPSPSDVAKADKNNPLHSIKFVFTEQRKKARQLLANRQMLERIVTRWMSNGEIEQTIQRQSLESPDTWN